MISLGILLIQSQLSSVTRGFYDYLAKPEPAYAVQMVSKQERRHELRLTSQIWQGVPWKHTVITLFPQKRSPSNVALLYVTGGDANGADLARAQIVAEMTNLPVTVLFQIPNQPIWGMVEDDLIAHTFEKYLQTKDSNWPLLFPMTKSVIKAMDAVQESTASEALPIKKFVVSGFSKRGWTAWFSGAARDKRVIGIIPAVIDNLNIDAQMKHQIASWGKYSEQIQDYTRRGLQAKLETPEGKQLSQMVDPYTYRNDIKVPTLILTGGNDPYWTVDAMSKYVPQLKQPLWTLTVPNTGHGLGDLRLALETIRGFTKSLIGELKMPTFHTTYRKMSATTQDITIRGDLKNHLVTRIWVVTSPSLDFRAQTWNVAVTIPHDQITKTYELRIPFELAKGRNSAVLIENRYRIAGIEFSLTSPPKVFAQIKK